jgi:hypothetical protein
VLRVVRELPKLVVVLLVCSALPLASLLLSLGNTPLGAGSGSGFVRSVSAASLGLGDINPGFGSNPLRETNCINCVITLAESQNNMLNYGCVGPACALPSQPQNNAVVQSYFGVDEIYDSGNFRGVLNAAEETFQKRGISQGIVARYSRNGDVGHVFNSIIEVVDPVTGKLKITFPDGQSGIFHCIEAMLNDEDSLWSFYPVKPKGYPRLLGVPDELNAPLRVAVNNSPMQRGAFPPGGPVPIQLRHGAGGPGNLFGGIGGSGNGYAGASGLMNLGAPVPPYNNRPRPPRVGSNLASGDCLNTVCPY